MNMTIEEFCNTFILLFAVIDPIGTIPVFIAVTSRHKSWEQRKIAVQSIFVSTVVLLFFIVAGQFILEGIGVPLSAFQIAGGIVLFLFALTMIFGDGKLEGELEVVRSHRETAIFPLAIPSIASPGAMMAVVMLMDNHRFSITHQVETALILFIVLIITLALLLLSRWTLKLIGNSGASIISRIMGLILSSVAANSVLQGIVTFFNISLS